MEIKRFGNIEGKTMMLLHGNLMCWQQFEDLIAAAALSVWDGVRNGFGFLDFFVRFLAVLYAMEIYDIIFFDWVLLCHSNFFPHFYPELKGVVGPHMFGYNKRTHIRHFVIYIPASAVAAWLCALL